MADAGRAAVAIESSTTQQEIAETILRMEAPAGLVVSVVGLDTSDQMKAAGEIITDLPGWQSVALNALPWEREVPHALTTVLRQRVTGGLDVPGASTVVVLRDALWADAESFQNLVGTARQMVHGRLVLILTGVRAERGGPEDAGPNGLRPPWGSETLRGLIDSEVHLRPLERDEVQALAMDETGMRLSPGTVSRLRDATGGWPGRIRDVLHGMPPDHWAQPDPTVPLPDQWYRRYRNSTVDADPEMLSLLTALAIFPTGCDMPLLRTLADTAPDLPGSDGWFNRALSDCVAADLIQTTPGAVSPRLSLVRPTDRAVIRALTPPDVSAALHRSAADYALRTGDTDAAVSHRSIAQVLTGHHDSAPLVEHGTRLTSEGQWVRAATMFILAAEIELDRARSMDLLLAGLDSLAFAGDIREVRWRIADLHQTMDSAQLNSLRGYVAFHEGRRRQAQGLLDRAGESLPSGEEQGVLASRMVQFNLADWDMEAVVAWARRAAETLPVESGARQESDAIAIIGRGALDGRLPEGQVAGTEGPLRAQSREIAEGWVSLALDNPVGARERLHTRPQIEGSARISQWRDAWLARTCLVLGDLATASSLVDGALARAHHFRIELHEPLLLWTGVTAAALRGETEKFRDLLRRLTVGPDAFAVQRLPAEMTRLFVGNFTGERGAALQAGRTLVQIADVKTLQPGFWPWEDLHALNLVHAGAFDEAESFLADRTPVVTRSGVRSLEARLMVPRALLVMRGGETDDGVRLFEAAVEILSSLDVPLYEGQVLYEYGQALRRLGRRRAADDVLRRAAEVFAAMGAAEMVRRCERDRRASGLGPRVRPDQLSDQEREIAGAVLRGSSNREIAAEFFLSTKTVEYHLTRMYRKLGVVNRGELVMLLSEQSGGLRATT